MPSSFCRHCVVVLEDKRRELRQQFLQSLSDRLIVEQIHPAFAERSMDCRVPLDLGNSSLRARSASSIVRRNFRRKKSFSVAYPRRTPK